MDHVKDYHEEVVITKHGKPVAKLVPVTPVQEKKLFGFMSNSLTINGDITAPLDVEWDAVNEK